MNRRHFLRGALTIGAFASTGLLSACGQSVASAPQPTAGTLPATIATGLPTAAAGATAVPTAIATGAPTAITAATAAPAPTARPAPPTAVPPPAALLGPEWNVLASGDLYGDGSDTAIGYIGSDLAVPPPPAAYSDFGVVATQLAIVQRNGAGQPWVRVHMTAGGTVLDGSTSPVMIEGGPNDRTLALRLSFPAANGILRILPVAPDGQPAASGVGFDYNGQTRNFDIHPLLAPGAGGDDPNGWPGNGWQMVTMGDYNGDNVVEHVYYRPSSVLPDPSFASPAYAAYTLVASEVMIAQGDASNNTVLAAINTNGVQSDSLLLNLTNGAATPAAFMVAAPSENGLPVAVIPINANGQGYMQGFGLRWDASEGAYRIAGPPQS